MVEDFLFHFQIGFDVFVRCQRAFVAKPQSNGSNVYARLQQVHSCGMAAMPLAA